jgi:hypothetical protein
LKTIGTKPRSRSFSRRHPALGEAAQQEHAFFSDGVDDVANLLVVEQEIDELRDLNVIDGDRGLILICDDQVLLLGSLQL